MTIYGVGYKYGGRKDVSKDFFDNGIACMNHNPEKFPYFVGLFREIKESDIIVLKKLDRTRKRLGIRAIGRVNDPKFEEKGNLGYGVSVDWIWYGQEEIEEIETCSDGGWHQRGMAIYKEYTPEICKEIEKLIEKYED